jgi:hypothetical protein
MRRTKHAAPGQYLGFALQPVRLCFHLLTCPNGARVSMELLDDVAVHYPDGSMVLEQAKSALTQNPLSDLADDFWKCLANWLDSAAAENVIELEKTQFRLYVTPIRQGERCQKLSDATTHDEVEAIRDSSSARIAARALSARVSPLPRKDPTPWMTSVHSTPITTSRESSRRRL